MPHWARKKDQNHRAICDAFLALGWCVLDISRAPLAIDLIVAKGARVVLVEVKAPKGKVSAGQAEILKYWPGETAVIRSLEDVWTLSASAPPRHSASGKAVPAVIRTDAEPR